MENKPQSPQRIFKSISLVILLLFICFPIYAKDHSLPDFSTYQLPETRPEMPRSGMLEYLDVAVLLGALALASWLAIKKRSRVGLWGLMVFSFLYFGLFRQGCVCSVGSIQNVALALYDRSYIIPVSVMAFFLLPLIFALFFGRVFCAAVCPLGAMQDLAVIKPLRLPRWLTRILRVFPYIYLITAIVFVLKGLGFIICQYDPFIGFFRFSGESRTFILGGGVLLVGMFIARPYCRFICPYGVLLGWMSRFSRWSITICPAECTSCGLCVEACPFGAIHKIAPEDPDAKKDDCMISKSACFSCGRCFAHCPKEFLRVKKTGNLFHTNLLKYLKRKYDMPKWLPKTAVGLSAAAGFLSLLLVFVVVQGNEELKNHNPTKQKQLLKMQIKLKKEPEDSPKRLQYRTMEKDIRENYFKALHRSENAARQLLVIVVVFFLSLKLARQAKQVKTCNKTEKK